MKFYVFVAREKDPDYKSASIMFYTKADYSHAGVIIGDTIYHAIREGVCKTTVEDFLKTHDLPIMRDVSEYISSPEFAVGWCEGNLGKDYSETQLMAIVLGRFKKILGDGRSEMICSEFASRFLDECSVIPIFDHVDLDFIDPVSFIEAVVKFLKGKEVNKNG